MNATHGMTSADTLALTRRVTLMSVATAVVLVSIKMAAWIASDSTAMLASLADSGLDLVASLVTFFAVRYAAHRLTPSIALVMARPRPLPAWFRPAWSSPPPP